MNLAWFSLFIIAMAVPQEGGYENTYDSKPDSHKSNHDSKPDSQKSSHERFTVPEMLEEVEGIILKSHRGRVRSFITQVVVGSIIGLVVLILVATIIYVRVKRNRIKREGINSMYSSSEAIKREGINSMYSSSEEGTLNYEDEYQKPIKMYYSKLSVSPSIPKSSFVVHEDGSANKYGLSILKNETHENSFKKESMIKPRCLQHESSLGDFSNWRLSGLSEISYSSRMSAISE
jgi:hypothetical protein